MLSTYTAKYIKINSGYMGQLIEWPEVITEGSNLEECREMLQDALNEIIIGEGCGTEVTMDTYRAKSSVPRGSSKL